MTLSFDVLLLLFAVATLAGFIDSMAGGGGLLTIPALLMTGMPPAMALGTNKLQACGGSLSASWYFYRKGMVDLKQIKLLIFMMFLGATFGTILIQLIDSTLIKEVLPFLIFAMGLYFLFTPNLGQQEQHKRISYTAFAFSASFSLGFYDGFFGPGTGSLLCLAFVTLLGFNLTKATAHAKILNLTSNLTSLFFFLLGGKIYWLVGFVMLIGEFIGAHFGAKLVFHKGQRLIRPMVVLMSFILTLKMVYDQHWFF